MTRRIVSPDGTQQPLEPAGSTRGANPEPAAPTSSTDVSTTGQLHLLHTDTLTVAPELRPDRTNQPQEGEKFGSEFLDNVAHQMVAPLQSIEMHCKNIIDGVVLPDKRDMRLREVMGHARMLTELARRMRFLHELVSGKIIDVENLEFSAIVSIWIEGFNNYLPAAQNRKIDCDIDHQGMNPLPPAIASRLAVQQVVMNLYDNALKYGRPNSKIIVRGRRIGAFVVNEFAHGAGVTLSEEAATRIFERGYRADEAKRVRASGTGIGMWISKELMRSMQGDIRAFPTDSNRVTRFRLYWRVAP